MKSTADGTILTVLQDTVSSALKRWLDDNRAEFLRILREAVLNNERTNHEKPCVKKVEFLTVVELAQRWQLNPESVRRMIRQGRIPRVLVGRHNRIALATVEQIEKSGALASP